MKFVPIPRFPCTAEELADFRALVFMPRNIGAFPIQQVVAGTIPSAGPTVKPWRDNAAVWNPGQQSFTYTVQRGEVNLRLRPRQGDAGNVIVDAEGITEIETVYSMQATRFYHDRFIKSGGREFARIPKLVQVTIDRAEAQRLNIATPPTAVEVEWPIAVPTGDAQIPTTINPDVAFRYNPQTGRVEAFSITEYDREFPLVVGSGMSDQELVDAVAGILASGMSITEQAKAIRMVAR